RGPVEEWRLRRKVLAVELREKPIPGLSHFPDDTCIEGLVVADKIPDSNPRKVQHQSEETDRCSERNPRAYGGRVLQSSVALVATCSDRPFQRAGSLLDGSLPLVAIPISGRVPYRASPLGVPCVTHAGCHLYPLPEGSTHPPRAPLARGLAGRAARLSSRGKRPVFQHCRMPGGARCVGNGRQRGLGATPY